MSKKKRSKTKIHKTNYGKKEVTCCTLENERTEQKRYLPDDVDHPWLPVRSAEFPPLFSGHREARPVLAVGNATPSPLDVHHALVLVDGTEGGVFVTLTTKCSGRCAPFCKKKKNVAFCVNRKSGE